MTTITATRRDGSDVTIDGEAYDAFESNVHGDVITPESDGYDTARSVWNGMIDKRPALIVKCSGVSDVVNAVRFAREHDLVIAVRGGAHNVAGHGTSDGGLLIDLSGMKGVRVDPATKTAHAQAGLTWGEFDDETQAYGLATTGGTVANTGVAGLALGG